MVLPSTAFGLAVVLTLVLPGVVYVGVRGTVAGTQPGDREVGARVLQALGVSACLDAVYLLVLGGGASEVVQRSGSGFPVHPRLVAVSVLLMGFAAPAGLAFLIHGKPRRTRATVTILGKERSLPWVKAGTNYDPTPTAWEKAVSRDGGRWVKVRLSEGNWLGGWFGEDSFANTYPEQPELLIEKQYFLDEDGKFEKEVTHGAGIWIKLKDGDVVEWIDP